MLKRPIAWLTTLAFTILTFTPMTVRAEMHLMDVNSDGIIDVQDATAILSVYAQNAAGLAIEGNYDVNSDGIVSINDASVVLTHYALQAAGISSQPSLFIPYLGYDVWFHILPATQENVDAHDIIMDDGTRFSTETEKFFFGHFSGSFVALPKTKIGDEITILQDGISSTYSVIRSYEGHVNPSNTDILDETVNSLLFIGDNQEESIFLVTCYGFADPSARWVVQAVKL